MMTIAVASGKGGAGKTSFAAALTAALGPRCLAADCDVDAANGAIALGATVQSQEDYLAHNASRIVESACTGCGACVEACRFNAIQPGKKARTYTIKPELCERCGACRDRCLTGAIQEYDKLAGKLMVSATRFGWPLVHAELVPGEDTSGKLVRKVRQRASELAHPEDIVVVDAPPGIGCPVIASLSGVDLVVVIVEASVSGVRDASRLLELTASMKRKTVGIINKAGLDATMDSKAKELFKNHAIPLMGEHPFSPALRALEEQGKTWLDSEEPVRSAVLQSIHKLSTYIHAE